MAGKTRGSSSTEEALLELATISDRILKSESSQREVSNRVGQLEVQMEANTQQLALNNQQLEEIKHLLRERFATQPPGGTETSHTASRNIGREGAVNPRTLPEQQPPVNFEEEPRRGRENWHGDNQLQNQRPILPRFDFPNFSGENPREWIEECDFYFEVFQTPEIYKVRMATLHFTGDAREWYRSYKVAKPEPPWPILTDEVLKYFASILSNPVDEFKRIQQQGKVEEYIKNFSRAKSRLMSTLRIESEEFYRDGFISGLKDEIRNTIGLFNPNSLDDAFKVAQQIEVSLDTNSRKVHSLSHRSQINQETGNSQFKEESSKNWKENPISSAKNLINTHNSLTIEQKKARGLCFKCGEKYFQGHRCNQTIHLLTDQEIYDQIKFSDEEIRETEEATLAVCNPGDFSSNAVRIKGSINQMPITALIDSGATHSFLSPSIAHRLGLQISPSIPLKVLTAGSEELSTRTMCEKQKFELQGQELEANLRLLEVKGYDMILGIDWLAQVSPVHIDLKKGILDLKHNGRIVQLSLREKAAEVKVCEQASEVNQMKKKSDPNKLIVRLFQLEGSEWWPVENEGSNTGLQALTSQIGNTNESRDIEIWQDFRKLKLEVEQCLKGEGLSRPGSRVEAKRVSFGEDGGVGQKGQAEWGTGSNSIKHSHSDKGTHELNRGHHCYTIESLKTGPELAEMERQQARATGEH